MTPCVRPKVVHAINNLGVGGAETMCLEVIRHFSAWGDNAALVLDAKNQLRRKDFEALGVPITTLGHHPGQYFQLIKKSYAYFRQHQADALLCWSFGNHAFISLGAKLAGVKHIVASVQNAPPRETSQARKWQFLAKLGFVSTSHLVGCSGYVRDRLVHHLKLPPDRILAINNGCNVQEIHRRAQEGAKQKPSHPIIGMVARLNEIKDHKTLIQAMPMVLTQYPTAQLWLIGDGELRVSLEKLVANLNLTGHVKFWGNRSDVPELLGQMDVFAFSTTEAEGFGIALTEAQAAGVPAIASNVGPCAEVFQQGKWGHLVELANPEKLGGVILDVLCHSKRQPSMMEVFQAYDTSFGSQKYWNLLFDSQPKNSEKKNEASY